MKKCIKFAMACMFAIVTFCGCNAATEKDINIKSDNSLPNENTTNEIAVNNSPKDVIKELNVNGEVKEILSVEELVDFHLNGNKYPEGFVFEELKGYGRVLESSSSAEKALEMVKNHFTDTYCTAVETKLEVETNLFYGIYVKWVHQFGEKDMPSYYDEYVVSFKKDVYNAQTKRFGTKNKDEIKSILDYIYYSKTYQIVGYNIYSSEISIKEGKCDYVLIMSGCCYGDWGIQDELSLIKEVHCIDLSTGESISKRELLGTVFIDGKLTHIGGEMVD